MTSDFELEDFMEGDDEYILCKKCEEIKHISEFYLRKDGYYQRPCKKCSSLKIEKYRKTEEGIKKLRKHKLNHMYGITPENYDKIMSDNNHCQMCGKKLKKKNLDHCHKTKEIRGVLCDGCNLNLGCYETYRDQAVKYLPYNPFTPVKDFELRLSNYTGAPFVTTVNSCTAAIHLSLLWHKVNNPSVTHIEIPKHTYVSVPMQIKHSKFNILFRDENWSGLYQLKPFNIYDSARRFRAGMYIPGSYMCVSFHYSKILGLTQGGAILHSNKEADTWFKKMRFDGRTEGVSPNKDNFDLCGFHCYLGPEIASVGLVRLHHLSKDNPDLPNDDYPDLSQIELFK